MRHIGGTTKRARQVLSLVLILAVWTSQLAATRVVVTMDADAGLQGEYFNNTELNGPPVLTRTDATLDFEWESASPDPALDPNSFSVRWSGQVEPKYSETYTFHTLSDDGVRLWIDDQLIIDNWTIHELTEDSGRIALSAGGRYNIRVEYFQGRPEAATIKLLWSSASQAREIIPQGQLSVAPSATNQAPVVSAGPARTITLPATAQLNGTATDDGLPAGSTLSVEWSTVSGPGTVTFSNPAAASTTATFSAVGSYVVRLTASDSELTSSADVTIIVNAADGEPPSGELPPDPSGVAPPVDRTVATTIAAATEFLYTGDNPIQTGVAPGTINPQRAAVLRGRVMTRDGAPVFGVKITVLNHVEMGRTLSRADGMFDMAVNGGGLLTVRYEKDGLLPVQRQENVPWQDYTHLPDVVMIPFDSQVTSIDLNAPLPMQVAQGSPVTDEDGSRQATVLFPTGTSATMELPDGSTQPLSTLHVRATEYTIGNSGPTAMPATLPPTSGYTYCVELSVDEAVAAGATNVRFSQPLINYVENFLDFPAGVAVPTGYYDRVRGVWVPSDDGRVVKILSITNGLAELDVEGKGVAATAQALAALGVSEQERQRLAGLYQPGQSLWRVPITHFTPWDLNWPYGCELDENGESACDPPGDDPPEKDSDPVDSPECKDGSIIECQNQTLGESVGVTGTPFSLNYRSDRVPGRKGASTLRIKVTGEKVRNRLKRIKLYISVAGQRFIKEFANQPNITTDFAWDGKDVYGRTLQGTLPISVKTCYEYPAQYYGSSGGSGFARSFGQAGGGIGAIAIYRVSDTLEIGVCRSWQSTIGYWDARAQELGGWSLDVQHAYNTSTVAKSLYLGDGGRRSVESLNFDVITTVAGHPGEASPGGPDGYSGDGGPATQAKLQLPSGVAVGPDGSIYIADTHNQCIRRVGPDGIITTVAGTGGYFNRGLSGDGGPATQAQLDTPNAVAVGPDGSIYISDSSNDRIRRVGPDGIITTVAGTGPRRFGETPFSGDGGPATQAHLRFPHGIAVGPDGSIYIADHNNYRIRRVGPDGIITTVAGTGTTGRYPGDGGPATEAMLSAPTGVSLGPDGSLFISSQLRIRRVRPDGIITIVAGNGTGGFSGDGGPATQAQLSYTYGIAVGPNGSFYFADHASDNDQRIRQVSPDGIITTVAGQGGNGGSINEGGPATQSRLSSPQSVAIGPDSSLYIASTRNSRIRRVATALPGFMVGENVIPSEDGSEVYVFNGSRHLRMLDALTGAVLYRFAYDEAGRLTTITDGDNNVTAIERTASGDPTSIISPDGQRTSISLDSNGYLASIANPAGEKVQLSSSADGLLTKMIDPRGNVHQYSYDSEGRLTGDEDPDGGVKKLARTGNQFNYTVNFSSALDRTTAYKVESLANRAQRRTTTFPDGLQTLFTKGTDGTETVNLPDGMQTVLRPGPDPRWGMQAPLLNQTITTPGGLTSTLTTSRTATLSNRLNPFSLDAQTDTVSINGRTYTTRYAAATKTFTLRTPQAREAKTIIDARGRVTQQQAAAFFPTDYAYDGRGRLTTATQGTGADARTTTFGYNDGGYLGTITDPLGRTANFAYDDAGRITAQTLADGRVIRYTYDANSNVTSITPPGRPAHSFSFSPLDLTSAYTPPSVNAGTNQTRYAYNADKQLTRITRPDDQTLDFNYDNAGRLSTLDLPSGQLSYEYDKSTAKLTTIAAPGGSTLTYGYDGSLLKDTAWSGPISGTVSRTFDNNFRLTAQSINGGHTINFQYDSDSLLTRAGNLTLNRNAQNGLVAGTTLGSITDTWSYNNFPEPTGYSASYRGASFYAVQYTRDKLGRITQQVETIGGVRNTYNYTYDLAGRLTEVKINGATASTYTYDSNGNRLSHSGSAAAIYDDQDRLTNDGFWTYSYTANGELQSKTANSQTTTYDYDVLGNLQSVTQSLGRQIDYLIDGQNRRIGKRVDGALVQGFLYEDGLRPVAEFDGDSNVVSRFIYAGRSNVPDYMVKDDTAYRIISDHLGSPRLVINAATGQVMQRMDYDEFGRVLQDTNPGFQPFGFAGGIYDRDTGLVRFGARDYDAWTGRWTAKDPILFDGGDANLYGYVLNDPVNWLDPLGLFNVLVLDSGGRNGPTYGATITVTGANGETVTVQGSSWPNSTNGSPGVDEGEYDARYSTTGHKQTTNGVRVNDGGSVPTLGPNPAQDNRREARGINIHCGSTATNRGSAGCITIKPDQCKQVWKVLQQGETGKVKIKRTKR